MPQNEASTSSGGMAGQNQVQNSSQDGDTGHGLLILGGNSLFKVDGTVSQRCI